VPLARPRRLIAERQPSTTAVQVRSGSRIGEHVPALVQPSEDVLTTSPGGLVTYNERCQLDQSWTVHPVRLGEARSRR
jgi:hypothetical protein